MEGSSTPESLTFLHLSDVHFGVFEGERQHDLERRIRDLMLDDIADMHARVGDVDAVLVVGDIASTGAPDEFEIAAEFLDRACEIVACPTDRVICVPGNHDVDWRIHDSVHGSVRKHLRRLPSAEVSDQLHRLLTEPRGSETLLSPLAAYNRFALRYGCAVDEGHLTWAPKTFLLGDREVRVYGATSCWISDSSDSKTDDESKLVVGAFQCAQVAESRERVTIAMVHHPYSWLRDAVQVGMWLNRANILLTGHEHESGIVLDAAERSVAIASGAVNPARHEDGWIPAYNVLVLKESDQEGVFVLDIFVRAWNAEVAGFGPDARFDDPFEARIRLHSRVEEAVPTPPPDAILPEKSEAIDSDIRTLVFRVMHAAPDARQRAAAELQLIGESEAGGLSLDREILDTALRAGKLKELAERVENG